MEKEQEKTSKIEDKGRLSETLISILNEQIKNELMSSQIYRAMSCWLDDKGWIDASKYYFKASNEELNHMNKIYEFLFARNVLAVIPVTEEVKQSFESIRNIVEESLQHEILVSEQWENISNTAKEQNDNTTYEFAQWFLKEQIEEEEKFRNLLFKFNLDMPDWKCDELFAESVNEKKIITDKNAWKKSK